MNTKQLEKQKVGRPSVITAEAVQKLEAALATGFGVNAACYFSGVSRSVYYERKAADKEFSDKMRLAEEWSIYKHEKLDGDLRQMFEDHEAYKLRMDIFDKIVQEKTDRQTAILQELEDLTQGNKGSVIGASYILELCSRAVELFEAETTSIEQKRYLIETVLSNMRLTGEKLEFTLTEPFGALVNMSKTGDWCRIVDALQTSAIEANDDYKLKNLVELFGLSDSLI